LHVKNFEQEQIDLPEKPSIAVLPFNNMSGDPEQEYFSDGFTEDIITTPAKIHNMFVVARESSLDRSRSGRSVCVGRQYPEIR
jgi:adenylate cyclase